MGRLDAVGKVAANGKFPGRPPARFFGTDLTQKFFLSKELDSDEAGRFGAIPGDEWRG